MKQPWNRLLDSSRLGSKLDQGGQKDPTEVRTEFERDFDRIVFSGAFRRLHGKTQVFPLPESDTTHTRLTHSIEAACVGRSLGRMVGQEFEAKGADTESLAGVVAAACLCHDLGNPPFGHAGEAAFRAFFASKEAGPFIDDLNDVQKAELRAFEGNALGFRLLTASKPDDTAKPGGMALTNATLATFAKYPASAAYKGQPGGYRKYGVFHDDLPQFRNVAAATGLAEEPAGRWQRHPLSFLTEAADDICYRIMDLEDGTRLRLVSYDVAEKILMEICATSDVAIDSLRKIRAADQKLGYLRAKAIHALVRQAKDSFINHATDILHHRYDKSLLADAPSQPTLKALETLSQSEIYAARPVLQIEAAGFDVIASLLQKFLSAALDRSDSDRNRSVRRLIPKRYIDDHGAGWTPATKILNICEYIASMTDSFAVDTYRTLTGISLPNYQP